MMSNLRFLMKRAAQAAVAFALAAAPMASTAEDIDLFVRAPSSAAANSRPNILFVIDNSSNWSAANQQWPDGLKQGQSQLRALRQIVNELSDNVNVGLMMLSSSSGNGPDGAYVRFAVRRMTAANKTLLREVIGDDSCVDGVVADGDGKNLTKCIYKNFNGSEKIAVGQTLYSGAMFEAFKYFGGFTDPANAQTDIAGSPLGTEHFGPSRYSGGPHAYADPAAFTNIQKTVYSSPIDTANSCARSYLVFIGNGFPPQDAPGTLLTNVRGSTTQLAMPSGNGSTFPQNSDVNYADEWAKYLYTTDVASATGQQNITTFTIDVFRAQQDQKLTSLLRSMAKYGGGRYFTAASESEILEAMREIVVDIQAVSSVFTAATLPVSATNRTINLNEIYFGTFRPDADALPRWYGNLKRYEAGEVNGEVRLVDRNGRAAISDTTGQLNACAVSFWTADSGKYWDFSPSSAGTCSPATAFSDLPDGPLAEKGGAAQVLRRGNDPGASVPSYALNRKVLTCSESLGCKSIVAFSTAEVPQAAVGAADAAEHQKIVDHTRGADVNDENGNGDRAETRPSVHGDVVHSSAVPVSYGGSIGTVLFYGANNGSLRAVSGANGREYWSFIAPEHFGKLKRLMVNDPLVKFPGMPGGITPTPTKKDYFFDGTAGLYQNADNTKVWIFPTMRRGGRMIYGFDVTNVTDPKVLWKAGCPNASNDTGCTAGFEQIGQTWARPNVTRIKGYKAGKSPLLVVGGGYDACEDDDVASPACTSPKGNRVYVIDAETGGIVKDFATDRSVAADVTLVDRDGDGMADHAYVADTAGGLYRIDFSHPATLVARASTAWTVQKVAYTSGGSRKFLSAPSVIALKSGVYLTIGSGDRERPLITNYPFTSDVKNRLYMFIDTLNSTSAVNLDGSDMQDYTQATACGTKLAAGRKGWFMGLSGGRGEQITSSPTIHGGVIYVNTNRPLPAQTGVCSAELGEARGYAVNLLNASGVIGSDGLCGGDRSGVFVGGGLPASAVAGSVEINGSQTSVIVGGIRRDGGPSSIMGAQKVTSAVSSRRTRMYWYTQGNK